MYIYPGLGSENTLLKPNPDLFSLNAEAECYIPWISIISPAYVAT